MTNQEFASQMAALENLHFSFALKLTRSRQDAEDLVQETTLKAYRNIKKFKSGTNFKNWTATIMRNTFINSYRKRKTRRHINQSVEDLSNVIENKNVINNAGEMKLRIEELEGMLQSMRD
ncbi:MAG: RNA polymerase sigma factor, partial [Bacteroidota bacterium]